MMLYLCKSNQGLRRSLMALKISGIRSGFTQYWEGMYIRDMRVRVSFQKKTIRKEKLVTR